MNINKTISRNKLNSLYYELKLVREEIYSVTTTARKNMCDLEKAFILDGLEKKENYILLQLMNEKGILSSLSN
mgnify:CR=1 FL=1